MRRKKQQKKDRKNTNREKTKEKKKKRSTIQNIGETNIKKKEKNGDGKRKNIKCNDGNKNKERSGNKRRGKEKYNKGGSLSFARKQPALK